MSEITWRFGKFDQRYELDCCVGENGDQIAVCQADWSIDKSYVLGISSQFIIPQEVIINNYL